jgi:DNA-binding HxlR family transcriptional regulator
MTSWSKCRVTVVDRQASIKPGHLHDDSESAKADCVQRLGLAKVECPIARAIDQVGDCWSLLIVRHAFMGVRCFRDFEQRLGIPPSTLTRRLALLCKHRVLARRRYRSRPPRDEYVLTQKGLDLLPVVLSLAVWGNRWLSPEGVSIMTVDAATGAPIEPALVDRESLRPIEAGGVALAAGPKASARLRLGLATPQILGAQTAAGSEA